MSEERFDRIDARFDEMAVRFNRAEQRLDHVKADLGIVKADLGTVKADLGTVKADLGTVKADLGIVKADLGTAKADLGTVKADLGTAKADLGTVAAGLANLTVLHEETQGQVKLIAEGLAAANERMNRGFEDLRGELRGTNAMMDAFIRTQSALNRDVAKTLAGHDGRIATLEESRRRFTERDPIVPSE